MPLIVIFTFLNLVKIQALSPVRLDENAVDRCKKTGGRVVEESHGRVEELEGWPIITIECVCPDGERQGLYVNDPDLETWRGCRSPEKIPLIAESIDLNSDIFFNLLFSYQKLVVVIIGLTLSVGGYFWFKKRKKSGK